MIKIPPLREKCVKKTYFIPARCDNELIRFKSADALSIAFSSTAIWVLRSNVIAIIQYRRYSLIYSSPLLQMEIPQNTNF